MALLLKILCLAAVLLPRLAAAEPVVHHGLQVTLQPEAGRLQARDNITLPPWEAPVRFSLHAGLIPTSPDPTVRIEVDSETPVSPDHKIYRLSLPAGRSTFTLDYQGKITHPLEEAATGIRRDQQDSLGLIAPDNVYLDGNSQWYPQFKGSLLTFSLEVTVPPSWQTLSQGQRSSKQHHKEAQWVESHPQEEIYLLAAPFHVYGQRAGDIDIAVLLRGADPALAKQYLAAIGEYVGMYSRVLGPYPYAKFAVVENSWESGYGMPSFTLLGPRVMRLPFILRSSLPHEILHNWWGNAVYVDYSQGNWSEGLTAYLADHLLQEQGGHGAAYRRNALLRYTNYVSKVNDFPIKDFQGRHSEASQAVGYDKALMLFHMLRVQLGDRAFITALRKVYRDRKFQRTAWEDLRHAFETVARRSLHSEFEQWLTRRGAPSLQVRDARAIPRGQGYELTAVIEQTHDGAPYRLHVPIAVTIDGEEPAWQTLIEVTQGQQTIHLELPARPWRLEVDPEFDVFRRLAPGELPPTLSEALGAESLLMVLPSAASPAARDAYGRLARAFAEGGSGIEIRWDNDLPQLPKGRAVWLLGWENRFLIQAAETLGRQLSLSSSNAMLAGQTFSRAEHSVILTARHNGAVLVWLGSDNPAAIPGLARKLPHYGSYSYLAFQGDEPSNILKGQWQVLDSPLNIAVQQADRAAPPDQPLRLRPRAALIPD